MSSFSFFTCSLQNAKASFAFSSFNLIISKSFFVATLNSFSISIFLGRLDLLEILTILPNSSPLSVVAIIPSPILKFSILAEENYTNFPFLFNLAVITLSFLLFSPSIHFSLQRITNKFNNSITYYTTVFIIFQSKAYSLIKFINV